MRAPYPLSEQQFAAVTAPLGPQVVIAGAGSGKTTVMAARVVWLVASGLVAPHEVLGLTFTTKATHELGSRIRESLRAAHILPPPGERVTVEPQDPTAGEEPEEPTVSTYNAYAASLLTEHGLRIGHEPDTRVIADASRYQLAARVIARHRVRIEALSDHPKTVIDNLLALDGAMSEHLVTPADVREYQDRQRPAVQQALAGETLKGKIEQVATVLNTFQRRDELLGLVEAYRRMKLDLGLMDFSDQIELGARLAIDQPEVGALERTKYRVVLLDEYQDTSVAQARMLSRLFSGPAPADGRGHAVSAVGDPNQAIYGWRGASVSNIMGFGQDFPDADGSVHVSTFPLSVNLRSDARILQAANDLAAPLTERFRSVRELEPKPQAEPGTVRVAVHETYVDELAWLPDQVIAAHQGMDAPSWREIGVLTRDNAHAADVFDALTRSEIPVEIVGLQGLLRLPEVAEVVATLTLLHDLTANAELLTLLTGPRWAVGARDLALLGRRARRLTRVSEPRDRERLRDLGEELAAAVAGADPTEVVSLSDALDDPGDAGYSVEARQRFGLLAAELRSLRSHSGEPLLDLVRRIIDTTGIDVELASSVSPAAQARRDNLDLFVKAVAEFQAVDGSVTLPALLAYLQAEDEYGSGLDVATPTEADSVKLLTVHRSKGLEWDAVFLVGVAEGRFPSSHARTKWTAGPAVLPNPLRGDANDLPQLSGWSGEELNRFRDDSKAHEQREELRLGYVALTRARHLLVVSSYCWSPKRKTRSGPRPTRSSCGTRSPAGARPPSCGSTSRPRARPTRSTRRRRRCAWPMEAHAGEVERRLRAAEQVRAAMARQQAAGGLHRGIRTTVLTWSRPRWCGSGTTSSSDWSTRLAGSARTRSRCRCRAACPRRRWPGCATTRTGSRQTWSGRCPASRLRPPGSAPVSTPGSRPGSASRSWSTRTSCLGAGTRRSTMTTTFGSSSGCSRQGSSPTGPRWRSSRRSRWCSRGRSSGAGSMRSTRAGRWSGRLSGRRLEDQPRADGRPVAAGDLPGGLGGAGRRAGRTGARGVLLRAHRAPGRAGRSGRAGVTGAAARRLLAFARRKRCPIGAACGSLCPEGA